jgi:tRNA threonylcarbamoyl adenosine modification protein (Sua5/YciO/YrdC/YwlC family)
MAQFLTIHPTHPQARLISQAAEMVRDGRVIVYPTDSCYALGCRLDDRDAVDRIRTIRALDAKHHLTLVCRDLSEVARYARVDNRQFRLLKSATPGSYTFILEATREVPRRLQHPKRKTIGLRVPDHPVAQALLCELNEAMLSTSLMLSGEELPLNDAEDIRERLEDQVDLIIDSGACGLEMTTVVDLTGAGPQVLREGKGHLAVFGFA